MIEALLIIGLAAGLPMAYFRGRRSGYERHHCVWMPDPEDRAPQTFVAVACPTCGEGIDCELHIEAGKAPGSPSLTATIDTTDLEHHTLRHDEARHPFS